MAWRYASIILAQPFEVAKTLLQVQIATVRPKKPEKDPMVEDWRRKQAEYQRDSFDVCYT